MALSLYNPVTDNYDLLQLVDDLVSRPFYEPRPIRSLRRANDLAQQLATLRGDSEVRETDKEFCIDINIAPYNPEEVRITSNDNQICVHAKHEERQDKHGTVRREMTRCYTLPPGVDPKSVTSTMNKEGILRIRATKEAAPQVVSIPVEYKGC